jgi:phage tail sheath gpL-like
MNTSMATSKVLTFQRPTPASLDLVSVDARLEARVVAPGTMTLLSYVPDDGAFDAFLAMKIDGNFVTVALHKQMDREDISEAFSSALPPGYEAASVDSQSEVLILTILRVRPQVPSAPPMKLSSSDKAQRLRWVGPSKFTISGTVSACSFVELTLDDQPLRLTLAAGESALTVAHRLRAALPLHYQAILELPLYQGDQVQVTLLRRVAH